MSSFIFDITDEAYQDLAHYRAFERKLIIDEITVQLIHEPDVETYNRKRLRDNPIARWELKVAKFRAFYEIDNDDQLVTIVAIGHKVHNVLHIRGKVVHL